MRKKVGIVKRLFTLLLIFLLSINSFAAIVSDNDGSAFITKAEFDALKESFQSQIDTYNQSIDSKIDGAIASYLAGLQLATLLELPIIYNDLNTVRTIRWYSADKQFQTNQRIWYEYRYHGYGCWASGEYTNHELAAYHPNTPYQSTTWYLKFNENDYIEDFGTFCPRLFVVSTDVYNGRTASGEMAGFWTAKETGLKMLENRDFCVGTLINVAYLDYFVGVEIEKSTFTSATYVPMVPNNTLDDYCGLIGGPYVMHYSGQKKYLLESDAGITFTNISGGVTHIKRGGMTIDFKYPDELYNKKYNVKSRIFKPFFDVCSKVGPMTSGIPVASCEKDGLASLDFNLSVPGSYIIYVNDSPDTNRVGKHQYTGNTTSNNQNVKVNNIICDKNDTIYILYLPTSTTSYGTITFNKATLKIDN